MKAQAKPVETKPKCCCACHKNERPALNDEQMKALHEVGKAVAKLLRECVRDQNHPDMRMARLR